MTTTTEVSRRNTIALITSATARPQVATAVSDGAVAAIMANKAMLKKDAERA